MSPQSSAGSGTALLPLAALGAVLDVCERRGVGVLGIEGFELVGGGHRPRMDAILDLSDAASVEQSIADARRFADGFVGTELVVDIELDL